MRIEHRMVAEVMRRDLVTAAAEESLRVAAQRMRDEQMRCLLVPPVRVGDGVGILTSKDVVQVVMEEGEGCLDELKVVDLMTKPAICVQSDLPLKDCFQLMRSTGVRRLPVQHGSELVGLISCTDMFAMVTDAQLA